jgi:predicted nuclease of predicted toxin-antitoxin system
MAYVREFMRASTDIIVAKHAWAEDRVLITEDYDFGELVVRHNVQIPGLVILAMPDEPRLAQIERVLQLVARLGEGLRSQITIVELGRERRSPIASDEPVSPTPVAPRRPRG